jgi:hypothetical protein
MSSVPLLPVDGEPKTIYRELTSDEIATVEHVFAATGNPLPDPAISTFVGAIEDGKVIGFLVIQLKLHAEPMWIESGRSEVFTSLVTQAERMILQKAGPQYVYLFAPAGRVSQLAQTAGMQLEPFCIFSKLVQPTLPSRPVIDLLPMNEPSEAVQ